MTSSPLTGALAFMLLCLPSGRPQGALQGGSAAERAVRSLEERWLRAEDDPDTLDVILADDFVHVLPAGFITKGQQVAHLRSHPARGHEAKRFETLRVRVFGDAAVATGVVAATAADGRVHRTAFTDVFARRDGQWQAVSAQELPLEERPDAGGSGDTASARVRQDVDAGNQAWIDGLEAGDGDRAAAGFAPDAVSCGAAGDCLNGAAAIAAAYKSLIATRGRATAASVRSETLRVDHDLAYESGSSEARFPDGTVRVGRFSTVWKLQPDGHWKIFRNMGLPAGQP
jgi:uncharacterized protein (TIGR02246 family)